MNEPRLYDVPDLETLRRDATIETYRSSGPGGQRRDKKETAVRVRYILPPDISTQTRKKELVVLGTKYRLQARNIEYALEELQRRLEELYRPVIPRIAPEKPDYAKERIMENKIGHSRKKQLRRKPILE